MPIVATESYRGHAVLHPEVNKLGTKRPVGLGPTTRKGRKGEREEGGKEERVGVGGGGVLFL